MRVRGPVAPSKTRSLSEAAISALSSGDTEALLAINRAEFGGFRMELDDDDDKDKPKDDDDTGGGDDDKDKSKKNKRDDDDDDADKDDADRLERMERRMKAADKRASEAEAALQKVKDAEKSDLERAQGEVETITKERDALQETVNTLRLQNAFLTANEVTWHDPDTALALAQSKGYLEDIVDDDGKVDKKAMRKALKRLGDEHKYLVQSKEKDGKDDGKDGPSGEPAGGRSDNNKDDKAKKKEMRSRFPVLANR